MKNVFIIIPIILITGCANIQPVPVNGGAGVAVVANPQPGFWSQNWGKILSSITVLGGGYMVADHNGWLRGGSVDTYEKSIDTPAGIGNNNVVIIGNSGSISDVNIGDVSEK